jgi:hypothetical protein
MNQLQDCLAGRRGRIQRRERSAHGPAPVTSVGPDRGAIISGKGGNGIGKGGGTSQRSGAPPAATASSAQPSHSISTVA